MIRLPFFSVIFAFGELNKLHDMMVRTMVCNMQGKPTDTPIFEKLGYVNASVDTVRGKLVSNWKVNSDNTVTMTITVPVGTTADILLPIADSANVQLNGTPLAVQTGIQEIGAQDGRVLVRAISGTYTFTLGAGAIMN